MTGGSLLDSFATQPGLLHAAVRLSIDPYAGHMVDDDPAHHHVLERIERLVHVVGEDARLQPVLAVICPAEAPTNWDTLENEERKPVDHGPGRESYIAPKILQV